MQMSLFENLQKLNEAYVWLNNNNHNINWAYYDLPDNRGINHYVIVDNDFISRYSTNGKNTYDLDDSDDYLETIHKIFGSNKTVETNVIRRYEKHLYDDFEEVKDNYKYCNNCGARLNDSGECPKCLDFPDYEDSEIYN